MGAEAEADEGWGDADADAAEEPPQPKKSEIERGFAGADLNVAASFPATAQNNREISQSADPKSRAELLTV